MQRKQIQFTERQVAAIRREARRRQLSDAAVVRLAVDRSLGSPVRVPARQVARALAAVGRFRSGTRTTSWEHRALEDAFRS